MQQHTDNLGSTHLVHCPAALLLLREAVAKPAGAGSSRGSLLRKIEYMAVTLEVPQGFLAFLTLG